MSAPLIHAHQAGLGQKAVGIALLLQIPVQIVAGLVGIPQAEPADGVIGQGPVL